MTLDITSSPSGSTPNGCARLGPSGEPNESVRLRFCVFGPGRPRMLTTSGAASASTIRSTMKASEATATRSWRRRRQNSCSGERAAMSPPMSRNSRPPDAEGSVSTPPMLILRCSPEGLEAWICQELVTNLYVRRALWTHLQLASQERTLRARYSSRMNTLFDEDSPDELAKDPREDLAIRQTTGGQDADARPLAVRLRPRRIEDFVGQAHLLGAGSALRLAIEQGHPHSMILYGPPGSGKTTLARLVAEHSHAAFEELSAVAAKSADVRAVIERAAHRRQT